MTAEKLSQQREVERERREREAKAPISMTWTLNAHWKMERQHVALLPGPFGIKHRANMGLGFKVNPKP